MKVDGLLVVDGDLRRANWDDLNYPARIGTLAAAGVPMIQRDNTDHIVATQTLARQLDLGILYRDVDDLAAQLKDPVRMARLRANVWRQRDRFTFDYHAGRLVSFFQEVIAGSPRGHTAKLRSNPGCQELPTTVEGRRGDAPLFLGPGPGQNGPGATARDQAVRS